VSQESTLDKVHRLIVPVLQGMAVELVDLEYKREGRDWFLRVFIDKEGRVTLDDCADVSREIDALLEVEDVVDSAYRLEVSSPGLDRPLKKPEDYTRFRGRLVKVKTFEKLDPDDRGHSRKTFEGELLGLEAGLVRIRQLDKTGGVVEIPLEGIAKANLEFEF
jgi:ribosome maturation factor RimP